MTATDDTARRCRQAVVASPIGPLTLVGSGRPLAGPLTGASPYQQTSRRASP